MTNKYIIQHILQEEFISFFRADIKAKIAAQRAKQDAELSKQSSKNRNYFFGRVSTKALPVAHFFWCVYQYNMFKLNKTESDEAGLISKSQDKVCMYERAIFLFSFLYLEVIG